MAKDTIKLAGPDAANMYRVLATKGTLKVRPGELYTERFVEDELLTNIAKRDIDTSFIQPKYDHGEVRNSNRFRGTPIA